MLPLKTLLVYLDMEGIIRPKYTRFDEYAFQYRMPAADIIDKFEGERRAFVQAVLNGCRTKKIWTYVDMPEILQSYGGADRQRVIAALEYFSEKGWIELQAKQEVEAYEILKRDFDIDALSGKMCGLFAARENQEIQRIHAMVDFFESDSCLSRRLARYFGDDIGKDRCEHCSFCRTGRAALAQTVKRQPLNAFAFPRRDERIRSGGGGSWLRIERHEIPLRRLVARVREAQRQEAPPFRRSGAVSLPGSQKVGRRLSENATVKAADGIRTHNIYLGKVALYH